MRYLLIFAALCASAQEFHIFGYEGPETVYRGKTAWFAIRGGWMTWRTVSLVTVGNPGILTTSTTHNIPEGTTGIPIYFKSTGTVPNPLPTGFVPMFANNSLGNTLEVNEVSSYASLEFLDAGSGTISVGTLASYPGPQMTYSMAGNPAGTTYEVWRHGNPWPSFQTTPTGNLFPQATLNSGTVAYLGLVVSDTATLGAATITFTVTQAAMGSVPVSIPITVAAMPTFNVARPASATTVPMLPEFTQSMKAIAARNCVKATGAITSPTTLASVSLTFDSTLGENQFGYYDGGWAMDQLAEFTGDTEWRNCGNTVAGAYRDFIMADNDIQQHRIFPDGLARRMRETRDGRYRHALHRLVTGVGAYSETGGTPGNVLLRETAYVLNAAVSESQITGDPLSTYGQRAAEFILADFEQNFVNDWAPQSAVFQDALATQALIKYWELTGDTRVPSYVKLALDWWWDNAYEPLTGQFYYTARPYGNVNGSGCWKFCKPDLTNAYILTALIMPAYGWYYSVTGDTTYRDRGDAIFIKLPFHAMPESLDATTNTFTLTGHGLVDQQAYILNKTSAATGHLGGGVYDGYNGALYVRDVTANTYKLSFAATGDTRMDVAPGSDVRNWVVIRYGQSVLNSGKESSQNMRWIMKYVRWRQLLD